MATAARAKRVVVLDDKPEEVRDLKRRLQEAGTAVEIVDDLEKLEKAIEASPVEAAFIDWQIHDFAKGPEALQLVKEVSPAAARIVLTKHAERQAEAMRLEADAFLIKGGDQKAQARVEVDSVRLGFARQLVQCLRALGYHNVREFEAGEFPDLESEQALRDFCTKVVLDRAVRGMEHAELRDILIRRGWRRPFDKVAYARSTWREKVTDLAAYAGAARSDLALILAADEGVLTQLLEHGVVSGETARLSELADYLLSVLAFVLELSNYDPDLMRHYWTANGLNTASVKRPPWDDAGLGQYLTAKGPSGLIESLVWIRSN